jgi:hypothetical protein
MLRAKGKAGVDEVMQADAACQGRSHGRLGARHRAVASGNEPVSRKTKPEFSDLKARLTEEIRVEALKAVVMV